MKFERTWDDMLVSEKEYQEIKKAYVHIDGTPYTVEELREKAEHYKGIIEANAKNLYGPYAGLYGSSTRQTLKTIEAMSEALGVCLRMIDELTK